MAILRQITQSMRVLSVIRVVLLLIGSIPLQAAAHAILVEAKPARDAKVQKAPESVELRFDAPVGKRYLALAIVDGEHRRVDRGDAARDLLDPSVVRVHLKEPLFPGGYLVRYRVQSADGHIVTGSYRFTLVGGEDARD